MKPCRISEATEVVNTADGSVSYHVASVTNEGNTTFVTIKDNYSTPGSQPIANTEDKLEFFGWRGFR